VLNGDEIVGSQRLACRPTLAPEPDETLAAIWQAEEESLDNARLYISEQVQITKHYYANGRRIATRLDDELYYLHSDPLGSTTLVTDENGDVVGRVQYDPYGNLISNSLPAELSTYLFTGQRWDEDLDLYDYRARFYDPQTGSFISPDSIIPDPLNPAAWNRYAYVYGNPECGG
jgi:RHS repeat-associated protein